MSTKPGSESRHSDSKAQSHSHWAFRWDISRKTLFSSELPSYFTCLHYLIIDQKCCNTYVIICMYTQVFLDSKALEIRVHPCEIHLHICLVSCIVPCTSKYWIKWLMNKWSYVSVLCYAFQTRVVSYKSSAPKQFTYLGVKGIYFKLIDSYEDICPVHVGEEVNDE